MTEGTVQPEEKKKRKGTALLAVMANRTEGPQGISFFIVNGF